MKVDVNTKDQYYKGIRLNCIARRDYKSMKAKRFIINGTEQNVWIPNKHLEEDGTIKSGENIDYVFFKAKRQCELAGASMARRRIYAEYYKRQRQAAARRHAHSVEDEDWTNICLNG